MTGGQILWRYARWSVAGVVSGLLVLLITRWVGAPEVAMLVGNAVMLLGTGFAVALLFGLNLGTPQSSILAGRDDPLPLQSTSGAVRIWLFCLPVFVLGFWAID